MKNLSFRQLRIFESAARLSSFARAAAEMHLSAPAISMQMKDLEEDLGMPLFAKRGRGLVLTSAGEYFLVYARRVLIALKETEDMMLKLKGMEIGTLNIGLVSTAKYIAPHLLARFRLEHPGIKLVIHVRNRDQLIGLLREAAIDVASWASRRKTSTFGLRPLPTTRMPLSARLTILWHRKERSTWPSSIPRRS